MLRRFWRLAGGFWLDRAAWRPRLVAAGLLGLSATEVALLLRFNQWNRDLFDVLERRDGQGVLVEGGVLLAIAAGFATVSFLHLQARRHLALHWRAWLAHRLTADWLGAGGPTRPGGANADGRIAEDARIATEEAVELASSLAYSAMVLACFVGVLWTLSGHPAIPLGGIEFQVPGYLLWVAVLFAGLGAAIPALLGRRLERATTLRQAMEAEYREALVRARDAGGIAGPHAPRLRGLFGAVAGAFREQTAASAILQLFCAASARLGQGIPYLVATPAWLAGVVTLGWVMQAAQAFTCVAAALSWPVDHMPRIATWRASAERVLAMDAGHAPLPLPAPQPRPELSTVAVAGLVG
jgi:putative ATP-binding cassette transporter